MVLKKEIVPIDSLESSPLFERRTNSLSQRIIETEGIIAEHKRRSPSKPNINFDLRLADVAQGYESAGVAGMSVLTNSQYFGGSLEDLMPYNEEKLAVSIYESKIPIITGIGHQPDITIADYAADKAMETPTAAAVYVAPEARIISM